MQKSTIIDLLGSFSKEELKEFDALVSSEYFNRKSAVLKLWKVLAGFAPEFSSAGVEREKLYSRIFPGKEFNYGTMKNLIYDLTKLAERFIELKIYNKKQAERSVNLLEGYLERGLNGFFEKNIKAAELQLEESKGEAGYHGNKYILEVLKQNYLIQQDKYYQTAGNIRSANENLTLGYFIDIFNNNYNSLCMHEELSGEYRNDFIEKFLSFFKTTPVEADHRVKIYYHAFMLIYNGSIEHFHELRKQLEENIDKLSNEQKYNFFVALANYCLKKFEEGMDEFAQKEYEVYRFMIDNGIYSIEKVKNIDGAFYQNVSGSAVKAGEFKWALYFIENYRDMLEPDLRENYYFHALIEYNLKLKNFEDALIYLSRSRHTKHVDKLNIKRWEIITGYELGHFEELRYLIDTTRHFVQNDTKVSPLRKERLSNFIYIVNKLVILNENKSADRKGEIMILKEELNRLSVYNKAWLLEKIDEL